MKLNRATLKAIVIVTLIENNYYNYPVTDICLADQQTIYCGQETNASPFNIHSSHIARMHLSVRCLAKTRTNQSNSRRNRSFNCLTAIAFAIAIAIAILLRRAARGRHSLRLLGQTNRLLQGPHVLRPLPRLRQLRAAQDLRLPTARRPILLRRVAQDVRVPCPQSG